MSECENCGHDVLSHSPIWGCVDDGENGEGCGCDGYVGSDPRGQDTED